MAATRRAECLICHTGLVELTQAFVTVNVVVRHLHRLALRQALGTCGVVHVGDALDLKRSGYYFVILVLLGPTKRGPLQSCFEIILHVFEVLRKLAIRKVCVASGDLTL